MSISRSALVGFLVVPLIPAVIGAAQTRVTDNFDLLVFLGFTGIIYFVAASLTLVFGVPAFLFLSRFKLIRWWSALGVGAGVGAIMALVLRLPNHPQEYDFALLVPQGAASGFCFWLIWKLGELAKARKMRDGPETRSA